MAALYCARWWFNYMVRITGQRYSAKKNGILYLKNSKINFLIKNLT
jgi:hypothetical protein